MIVVSPTDPLATGLAGLAAGALLGVGGALTAPHVIRAARAVDAAVAKWWAARRVALSRAAPAASAGLPAEVLAAIAAVVRAELDKAAPAAPAPAAPAPAAPAMSEAAPPASEAAPPVSPWIVR